MARRVRGNLDRHVEFQLFDVAGKQQGGRKEGGSHGQTGGELWKEVVDQQEQRSRGELRRGGRGHDVRGERRHVPVRPTLPLQLSQI